MNRACTKEPVRPAYVPALDGLRGVAVLMVVAYHARLPGAGRGDLGVDVFFGLSGFLITALVLAEYRAQGSISLRRFWERRFVRLFPAYALVVVVCVTAAALSDFPGTLRGALLSGLHLANWASAAGLGLGLLRHTWSLSIEEQFYLIWPVLLAIVVRFCRPRHPATACLLVTVAAAGCTVLAVGMLALSAPEELVANATPTRCGPLLLGAALAIVLGRVFVSGPTVFGPTRYSSAVDLAGCLGLVSILAVATLEVDEPNVIAGVLLPLVSVATAACVSACVLAPGGRLGRLLGWPPLVAAGRMSYGMYLWHFPLFMMVDVWFGGLPAVPLAGATVLSVLLAQASHRWLEQPLIRAHRRALHRAARPGGRRSWPEPGGAATFTEFTDRREQ